MGNENQPWLDSLSDDWVSMPGTPTTPITPVNNSRSVLHSRRSSLQSSPSRIPVPARRSVKQSPIDPKKNEKNEKKVTRPCHFIKREPVPKVQRTPIIPRTPKTPLKTKSPAPEKSTASPKPRVSAARKQPPPMDTRSPLRSVSNISSQSSQQGTVQIKPKRSTGKETTPEWRKRLVRGEIPVGDQRDLFGPIGLESVFKPPTPGSETAQKEEIPIANPPNSLWNFTDHDTEKAQEPSSRRPSIERDGPKDGGDTSKKPEIQVDGVISDSPPESPRGTIERRREIGKPSTDQSNLCDDSVQNDTHMRSASGLEDLRNEGITPVTFSQTNTMDGLAASEVLKSALKQIDTKLQRLSLANSRPASRVSDSGIMYQQSDDDDDDMLPEEDLLDTTSHSLPNDLSMGTLDFGTRGRFVNVRRGQYLGDGSFFKRQLTPSSFPSQRLSPSTFGNSRIRSSPPFYNKVPPAVDPPALATTRSADAVAEARAEAMQPFGSPLKLFGNHDTFTNNKLLRRMSQFEETFGGLSEEDEPDSPSEDARRKGENRSFLSAKQEPLREPSIRRGERPRSRNAINGRLSRFGDGQLDNFDFSDTSPYEPKLLINQHRESYLRSNSPRRSSAGRGHVRRASIQGHTRDPKPTGSDSNRKRWSRVRRSIRSHASASRNSEQIQAEYADYNETKRTPNTPAKDPHPKRRRTLPKVDSPDQEAADCSAEFTDDMPLLKSSLMKHGMDYEDNDQLVRSQSTHRPRTPTPSQTRSSLGKGASNSIAQPHQGSFRDDRVLPRVEITGAHEEVRKGSITTQDFLNEATKIMSMIRENGRAKGGLTSVEESDMESENGEESYDEESTQEGFSRPPSREDGVDMRKLREPQEPNPHILSHLRKFQEKDELEFEVSTSAMSLKLDDERHEVTPSPDATRDMDEQDKDGAESSPQNIRIRETLADQRKRKHSVPSANEDQTLPHQDLMTMNTQVSAKSFSARSVPTGSSQSSHAKGVLSSDLVSHLIPKQVNGFTYDRLKHTWVREKAQKVIEKPKGDESEDDPFKDIPDLSVDELEEMMRMHNLSSPERTRDSRPDEESKGANSPLSTKSSEGKSEHRSQTRDGELSPNTSSAHSKITPFTSSVPHSGTRATSWSTDDQEAKETSGEIEHEIQVDEDRTSNPSRRGKDSAQKSRVVTISFSSPLVSHIGYSDDVSPVKSARKPYAYSRDGERVPDYPLPSRSSVMLPLRQASRESQPFLRRPISRIDERNEDTAEDLSLVRRNNAERVQSASTESHVESSLADLGNAGPDTSYNFHLSPLADFTVNQIDHPLHLEVSYVAQRTHPTSLRQVHGTFALATEELVRHITDVEPYEPYWEHVRRLVLRDKGLITLHRLHDFCPRLEDLDVSYNEIGQLSGIPSSLRTLKIQHNCLSSLTSWGHLMNLQYLDVSGNDLENLDGFTGLVHLRELRANDNRISNIDGILDLNGLLSLKLSNNSLTTVDFEGAELTRLKNLDLSHNQLTSVRDLDSIPSIETLNLSFNRLNELETSLPLRNLRSLKLSHNYFRALDISGFPSLNLLYLDQNFLITVAGLEQCRHLEVLSVREQMLQEDGREDSHFDIDLGLLKDIRKVFLSSNRLTPQSLSPSAPLLSLQLLDVASCTLRNLPAEFASNFPNLKVLNLNFNSLTSIGELMGMNCLSRLTVASNRIVRMRRLCQALSHIGRTPQGSVCSLQKVDLRGNPLTIGFYPPPVTGTGRIEDKQRLKSREMQHVREKKDGGDIPSTLANIGRTADILHSTVWGEDNDTWDANSDKDAEVDDPYILPPADPQADKRYLSHLDDPTRLRRRVLELMLYAGTGGSIKFLDGLELRPTLGDEGSDMHQAWDRLEELGVLKRKAIRAK